MNASWVLHEASSTSWRVNGVLLPVTMRCINRFQFSCMRFKFSFDTSHRQSFIFWPTVNRHLSSSSVCARSSSYITYLLTYLLTYKLGKKWMYWKPTWMKACCIETNELETLDAEKSSWPACSLLQCRLNAIESNRVGILHAKQRPARVIDERICDEIRRVDGSVRTK